MVPVTGARLERGWWSSWGQGLWGPTQDGSSWGRASLLGGQVPRCPRARELDELLSARAEGSQSRTVGTVGAVPGGGDTELVFEAGLGREGQRAGVGSSAWAGAVPPPGVTKFPFSQAGACLKAAPGGWLSAGTGTVALCVCWRLCGVLGCRASGGKGSLPRWSPGPRAGPCCLSVPLPEPLPTLLCVLPGRLPPSPASSEPSSPFFSFLSGEQRRSALPRGMSSKKRQF